MLQVYYEMYEKDKERYEKEMKKYTSDKVPKEPPTKKPMTKTPKHKSTHYLRRHPQLYQISLYLTKGSHAQNASPTTDNQ